MVFISGGLDEFVEAAEVSDSGFGFDEHIFLFPVGKCDSGFSESGVSIVTQAKIVAVELEDALVMSSVASFNGLVQV